MGRGLQEIGVSFLLGNVAGSSLQVRSHRAHLCFPRARPMGAVGPEFALQFPQHVVLSLAADGLSQPRTHCADSCCSPLSPRLGREVCAVRCQQGVMEGDSAAEPGFPRPSHWDSHSATLIPTATLCSSSGLQRHPVQICVQGDGTWV